MADHRGNKGLMLGNRLYDILLQISTLGLPGLGAFYFALAGYWNLPHSEAVVGSCAAAGVFLGVILKMSRAAYNNTDNPDGRYDGDALIGITDPDRPNTFLAAINKHPGQFADQDEVRLKVKTIRVAGDSEVNEDEIPA